MRLVGPRAGRLKWKEESCQQARPLQLADDLGASGLCPSVSRDRRRSSRRAAKINLRPQCGAARRSGAPVRKGVVEELEEPGNVAEVPPAGAPPHRHAAAQHVDLPGRAEGLGWGGARMLSGGAGCRQKPCSAAESRISIAMQLALFQLANCQAQRVPDSSARPHLDWPPSMQLCRQPLQPLPAAPVGDSPRHLVLAQQGLPGKQRQVWWAAAGILHCRSWPATRLDRLLRQSATAAAARTRFRALQHCNLF